MYGSPWQTKPGVFISGSSWLPQRGKASLQQKILLWNKKPVEFALSDIDDIAVKSDVDGLSGASIHHSVLHRRTGEIAVLTTEEAKDAAETVKRLREFLDYKFS